MKEYLREQVRAAPTLTQARNIMREYLQAEILAGLQRAGAMIPLAFHGGTALRFLYNIARYSEDLDFALEREQARYNLRTYLDSIRSFLTADGYVVEMKVSDQRVVQSAFVRFPQLLYDLQVSPHRSEMFAVKLEVDTRPPAGAQLESTVVRKHELLQLQHHNRASLFSGKLHALLQRPFAKGRDLYDLVWYLSDPEQPGPNLILLNHALVQTNWHGQLLTQENWRHAVWAHIENIDWKNAVADVRPFLEKENEAEFITRENVRRLLNP